MDFILSFEPIFLFIGPNIMMQKHEYAVNMFANFNFFAGLCLYLLFRARSTD